MIDHAKVLRVILDARARARDRQLARGEAVPPSVYDADVPDCRSRSDRWRGQWWHRRYGQMSRMYCVACGAASPTAVSEQFVKTTYLCNRCVLAHGAPPGMRLVADDAGRPIKGGR